MTRARLWWRAWRAPAFWAVVATLLRLSPTLFPSLVVRQSAPHLLHRFFCAPPSLHDCFLYLPATVWSVRNAAGALSYLFLLLLGIEAWRRWEQARGARRAPRGRGWIMLGAACAGLAFVRWDGPNIRLLPLILAAIGIIWAFLMLNTLPPREAEQAIARRRWVEPLLAWTFPLSDLFCVMRHRRRLGSRAGWLAGAPVGVLAGVLLLGAASQLALLTTSPRARALPVAVYDPHGAVTRPDGIWYADTQRYDAGLWRFDETTGAARSVARAVDLRTVAVVGSSAYLFDGFEQVVCKVDTATGRILWQVTVPEDAGAMDVQVRDGLVFASGEGGYVLVMDTNGGRKAKRVFAHHAWYPQILSDSRVAFIAPEQAAVRITGARLSDEEVIELPGIDGEVAVPGWEGSADSRVITALAYAEELQTLYVGTLWGEIFRYDLGSGSWLASFHARPGLRALAVDGRHGLVFAYSHARGVIDALSAASGARAASWVTTVFGNTLTADPVTQTVLLSARGPGYTSLPKPGGLFRWSYQARERR